MVAEALYHVDQLQDDCIRIRVGKELDIVHLEVIAFLVADHNSSVAVEDVSPRGGNGPLGVCDFIALVIVLFTLNDLQAIQEGQIDHQNHDNQYDHGSNSAGFYEMFHERLLYSSLLRRAGG